MRRIGPKDQSEFSVAILAQVQMFFFSDSLFEVADTTIHDAMAAVVMPVISDTATAKEQSEWLVLLCQQSGGTECILNLCAKEGYGYDYHGMHFSFDVVSAAIDVLDRIN